MKLAQNKRENGLARARPHSQHNMLVKGGFGRNRRRQLLALGLQVVASAMNVAFSKEKDEGRKNKPHTKTWQRYLDGIPVDPVECAGDGEWVAAPRGFAPGPTLVNTTQPACGSSIDR